MRRFALAIPVVVIAAAGSAAAVVLILDGDDGGRSGGPGTAATPPATEPHHSGRPPPAHRRGAQSGARRDSTRHQVHEAIVESKRARLAAGQRRVARVARAYVAAIDARDGRRACDVFAPGALSGFDFPRDRGDCARSLSASIGYRDPRGFPVYAASRIARIPAVAIDGRRARVTATTVTRFADNREASVEDDLIYLRRLNGRWLIAKPSATLYRAVGVGDIPPQVLAPP